MIAFLRTLGQAEIDSQYLNLTDDQGTTYGNKFPSSLTFLVIVDQTGRRTSAEKHHANQIWGTVYKWFRANRPKEGDQVVIAYDPDERIGNLPVVHLELLRPDSLSEEAVKDETEATPLSAPVATVEVADRPERAIGAVGYNSAPGAAPRRDQLLRRIVRDTRLSRSLKLLYEHECQLCGETIELPNGGRYSEAHHLRPLGHPHDGRDVASNVLVVCPNHHALLDLGVLRLEPKAIARKPGHMVAHESIEYHNTVICGSASAA